MMLTFVKRFYRKHKRAVLLTTGTMAALFAGVELLIAGGFFRRGGSDLEYLIVLGAGVKGTTPSLSLRYRIDEAAAYLKANPETIAVLSGGQGPDEEISEAACMKAELIQEGIEEERLLTEDQSTSTVENLTYSFRLISRAGAGKEAKVGIVTNGFHVFRAVGIARHMGYSYAEGVAAKSVWWRLPRDMFREFFAVVKEFLTGSI